MKLLVLSQYFWPENFLINDVAKSLLKKGVDVEVLTGKPNYPSGQVYPKYRAWGCQQERYYDIKVHRIPLLARGTGGLRLALNYLFFVASGLLFAPWLLRKKKFDAIFIYAPSPILQAIPAIFLGWLKGCAVVLWVQDLWPESLAATGHVKNKIVLKAVEWIVRFIYRHVDLLLVQSEAFVAPVKSLASGKRVEYLPNFVNETFLKPVTEAVPDIAGLQNGFSVMFAGNIGSAQAVEVIIEAAILLKDYKDIHFVVLGDGSRREWMLQQAKDQGLANLHLLGRFAVETMPGFMKKASVLLVTLADQQIFRYTIPSKVQSYLAAGRPIIACLNGEGAKVIATAGAGLTVSAGNSPALAEAVLHLYRMSPSEREAMGANGQRYYEQHYSCDMLMDQLIGHLQSARNQQ